MIKGCRYVSQVVLVGNERKFPAALIVPSFEATRKFCKIRRFGIKNAERFLRTSESFGTYLNAKSKRLAKDLSRYERVKKIALLEEELTVEGGELTPTLKIKRRIVNEKYSEVIEQIYIDAEKKKP